MTINPLRFPQDGTEFLPDTVRWVSPAEPCEALQKLRERSNAIRAETNAHLSFMAYENMMFDSPRAYIINEIRELVYGQ